MCPARPDPRDILRHPAAKKGQGRRRRAPEPEPDPRDRMMLAMLERIQQLNAAVAELGERVTLGAVRDQVHLRRIERLESALEATWTPPGATDAPEADRSDVPTPQTP